MLNIRDLAGLAGRAGPARPKAPPTASATQHPYLRNYLKIAIVTAGDTRTGHRPVAAGPGSCWPASRSAPVSPDTWTATPKSVPPPNAAPESASRHPGPTSPPQCAEYAADTRTPPPPGDQQDCHTPLSRHKLGAASPAVAGRATTMRSKVCTRSLASCTLAPDTTTLKG